MKKLKSLIASGMIAATLFLPTTAFAQDNDALNLSFGKADGYESTGVSSINKLLSAVFTASVIIAVIFVFFMLVQGGYAWITAGGDKAKVEEARTRITNAIIGLAIVASAFALISVVGQFFGVNIGNIILPSAADGNGFQECTIEGMQQDPNGGCLR